MDIVANEFGYSKIENNYYENSYHDTFISFFRFNIFNNLIAIILGRKYFNEEQDIFKIYKLAKFNSNNFKVLRDLLNEKNLKDNYYNYKFIEYETLLISRIYGWKLCGCWEDHCNKIDASKMNLLHAGIFTYDNHRKYELELRTKNNVYYIEVYRNDNRLIKITFKDKKELNIKIRYLLTLYGCQVDS